MKQITVIVKPFVAEAVLKVVHEHEVSACIVDEVKGYGRQKGYLDRYQGSEYSMAFLPKVEINLWVQDEEAERLMAQIIETARTGRIGDGKIFIQNAAWHEALAF